MESPLTRKLAAILYADVAGYSRLTSADEEGTHRRLAAALDVIAALVSARRGRVRHFAGDAVLADFATATDALACALLVQRSLGSQNASLPEAERLTFRVGLNLGEVIDDRGDVYGDGVNIAARLEAIAEPGGVCVSDALRMAVGQRLAVEFQDLGPHEMKNIPQPVRAWRVIDRATSGAHAGLRKAAVLRAEARAYGVLMGEDDALAVRATLDRCREVVRASVEAHRGRVAESAGETLLAIFDDAGACAACALAVRESVARFNAAQPPAERVHYRFGIDLGEVFEGAGGPGGEAVAHAGELARGAHTDGIRLSEAVFEHLPESAAFSVSATGAGSYTLLFDDAPTSLPPQLEALDLPLPQKPSILVMPFSSSAEDPDAAALADGLRLDIQNGLVKISQILLIAAGTANTMRGVPGTQAGPRLGARYVLEGSVRRVGKDVRVNAQLTDVERSTVMWSERYDRRLDNEFELQDEITERVVTALDVKLSSGEQARIWRKCLTEPSAREELYAGMHAFFAMNAESMARARAKFERVSELAPRSPLGPSWVAMCLWIEATRGWAKDVAETRARAGEWAERAAAMSDADGQAHTVLGNVRLLQARYDEALEIAREAVRIRPGCTNANGFLANVLLHCDEFDEAVSHARRAIRISPVYPPWFLEILAAAYREARQAGLAIAVAREALRLVPQNVQGRLILASSLVRGGWLAEAQSVAHEVLALDAKFSLSRYAKTQPYRSAPVIDRVVEELARAGLPS